jgi:hypothetical protein
MADKTTPYEDKVKAVRKCVDGFNHEKSAQCRLQLQKQGSPAPNKPRMTNAKSTLPDEPVKFSVRPGPAGAIKRTYGHGAPKAMPSQSSMKKAHQKDKGGAITTYFGPNAVLLDTFLEL